MVLVVVVVVVTTLEEMSVNKKGHGCTWDTYTEEVYVVARKLEQSFRRDDWFG